MDLIPRSQVGHARAEQVHVVRRMVTRVDPTEDFSDVIGSDTTRFSLENERPDRRYVWSEETRDDMARFQSGELGLRYKIEYYEGDAAKDGLCPVGARGTGLKKGDMIRVGSHVCMSVDRALWEKRKRFEALSEQQRGAAMAQLRKSTVTAGEHDAGWGGLDAYQSDEAKNGRAELAQQREQ